MYVLKERAARNFFLASAFAPRASLTLHLFPSRWRQRALDTALPQQTGQRCRPEEFNLCLTLEHLDIKGSNAAGAYLEMAPTPRGTGEALSHRRCSQGDAERAVRMLGA